jgi:hypothetical protein
MVFWHVAKNIKTLFTKGQRMFTLSNFLNRFGQAVFTLICFTVLSLRSAFSLENLLLLPKVDVNLGRGGGGYGKIGKYVKTSKILLLRWLNFLWLLRLSAR